MKNNLISALCLAGLMIAGMANAQTNTMLTTTTTTTVSSDTRPMAPDTAQLKQYVGNYSVATGDVKQIIITIERGTLTGEAVGLGQSGLVADPTQRDAFTVPDPNGGSDAYATVQFGRDAAGNVMKVLLNVQGQIIEGTRAN